MWLCLWMAATSPAQAHKLLVSATVEGGGLKVQAFFHDGNPAREAPVTVAMIPPAGHPPLSGKTDAHGVCRFAQLAPGAYVVGVGDPMGHRADARVTIPGAAAAPAASPPDKASAPSPAPPREPVPWNNILAGLGFIFGLSAFIMVMRLNREVKKLASRN
jgi:hypothetical protein